jgi:hypothetical protein
LQDTTINAFKNLVDYSLKRLDEIWNVIIDKFMVDRSHNEKTKSDLLVSLRSLFITGSCYNTLKDAEFTVAQACAQLEELVQKSSMAFQENSQIVLKDLGSRFYFLSIIIADVQFNLRKKGRFLN